MTLSRMARIEHAAGTAQAARDALVAAMRDVLKARRRACDDPKCRGWFVDRETGCVARCDDCAVANGYDRILGDFELALLPEARRAVARWTSENAW